MDTLENVRHIDPLRDARWQEKALEILARDNFTCQACLSKPESLVVHHRWQIADAKPWEYPDIALVTLCEPCRDEETRLWQLAADALIRGCRSAGLTAGGLATIATELDSRQLTFAQAKAFEARIIEVIRPLPRKDTEPKGRED